MYSKVWSRLDWFFGYIGEPDDELPFMPDLYGDVNFDGTLNITDVVMIVNFVLNLSEPTVEEFMTADINWDNIVNILDVIQVVSQILGTTFGQSVDWLEENFPSLNTKERLSELDKSKYFSKRNKCKELEIKYEELLKENNRLKSELRVLKRMDKQKMKLLKEHTPNLRKLIK